MKIRVKGYLTFRELVGKIQGQEIEIPAMSLIELLEKLADELDAPFEEALFDPNTKAINDYIRIMRNGRHYSHLPQGLDTQLQDGDEVALFPPIAGG